MEANIHGLKEVFQRNGSTYGSVAGTIPGHFGVLKNSNSIMWYTCREQFHTYTTSSHLREFYYTHKKDNATNVANFIYNVERHLGLVEKTEFMYTQNPEVSWIRMSKFWLPPMRYQLFTIFLRAAATWTRQSHWWDHIFTINYASLTRPAVERFLHGHTHYTGSVVGWYRQFSDAAANPTLLLVHPAMSENDKYKEIEKRAYVKWEEAGKPVGRGDEFWRAALEEFNS